jgi:hypothetical protein
VSHAYDNSYNAFSHCNFFAATYQNNFIVGLTNNYPATMSPTTYGYAVCGQWQGVAAEGLTLNVTCDLNSPSARYIVVLGNSITPTVLTVCELEVYGVGEFSACMGLTAKLHCHH